jgi:hypothetical protein
MHLPQREEHDFDCVYFHERKPSKPWRGQLPSGGRIWNTNYYATPREAAAAVDR